MTINLLGNYPLTIKPHLTRLTPETKVVRGVLTHKRAPKKERSAKVNTNKTKLPQHLQPVQKTRGGTKIVKGQLSIPPSITPGRALVTRWQFKILFRSILLLMNQLLWEVKLVQGGSGSVTTFPDNSTICTCLKGNCCHTALIANSTYYHPSYTKHCHLL